MTVHGSEAAVERRRGRRPVPHDPQSRRSSWPASWLAPLLLLAATGCEEPPIPPTAREGEMEPPLEALGSVRQPSETWIMTRTGERCEVTRSVEGQVVDTMPDRYACPKDLLLGERIRITGKTCIREGGPAERVVPVVCPDYLWYAKRELAKLRDGGK